MSRDFEWYHFFVRKDYSPDLENEIIVVFKVTPAPGFTIEQAAGRIASESSVGTWTTLSVLPDRIWKIMAKAYSFTKLDNHSYIVKVAYPLELFEEANLPGFLAAIAGNIFGMKALKGL
ncbi:MAG TPA: ribulose-bisphosphate carboxylase large subunit, partial [Ignisphaera sp.]|nr:ribulose-bisphosphate carboxylase large subunit [Ignisphaera sp.]